VLRAAFAAPQSDFYINTTTKAPPVSFHRERDARE
jgi:hypothetical protein